MRLASREAPLYWDDFDWDAGAAYWDGTLADAQASVQLAAAHRATLVSVAADAQASVQLTAAHRATLFCGADDAAASIEMRAVDNPAKVTIRAEDRAYAAVWVTAAHQATLSGSAQDAVAQIQLAAAHRATLSGSAQDAVAQLALAAAHRVTLAAQASTQADIEIRTTRPRFPVRGVIVVTAGGAALPSAQARKGAALPVTPL